MEKLTKVTRVKLEDYQVEDMVYDFVDDSLAPDVLYMHFKKKGIKLTKANIRRENGVLKIVVDGYKYSLTLKREK